MKGSIAKSGNIGALAYGFGGLVGGVFGGVLESLTLSFVLCGIIGGNIFGFYIQKERTLLVGVTSAIIMPLAFLISLFFIREDLQELMLPFVPPHAFQGGIIGALTGLFVNIALSNKKRLWLPVVVGAVGLGSSFWIVHTFLVINFPQLYSEDLLELRVLVQVMLWGMSLGLILGITTKFCQQKNNPHPT